MRSQSQSVRAGIWIVACILIVTTATAAGVFDLLTRTRRLNQVENPLYEAAWHIRHADEQLSNAARLYAATGEGRYREVYDATVKDLDAALAETTTLGDDQDHEIFAHTAAANDRLIEMENRAFARADAGRTGDARRILESAAYNRNKQVLQTAVNAFFDRRRDRMHAALNAQHQLTWYLLLFLLLSAILGVVATVVVFRKLGRNIFLPLQTAVIRSRQMSDGDLRTVETSGFSREFQALFQSINSLNHSFRAAISGIQNTAAGLYSISDRLTADASELTRITHAQVSSTEEVSATLEELNSGSESIADMTRRQSRDLAALTHTSQALAHKNESLQEFVNESNLQAAEIAGSVAEGRTHLQRLNASMQGLIESTSEVTQIIAIINSIADRINLLSLNASIEAARAGNAGRGFAVVASEISRLADQTAGSIGSIESIIQKNGDLVGQGIGNLKATTQSLLTIADGVQDINSRIAGIREIIGGSVQGNQEIHTAATRATGIAGQIESATGEHKTALREIVEAISNLNIQSQNISGMIERLNQDAADMNAAARQLDHEVAFFNLGDEPKPNQPATAAPIFGRAESSRLLPGGSIPEASG